MTELLRVQDLSVAYGDAQPVLEQAGFQIQRSEIVGIVGESGSGKSTLIQAILGLLPAGGRYMSGTVHFQGIPLLDCSREEWLQIRGKRIAMVFQDSSSFLNPVRRIGSQYIEALRTHFKLSRRSAYHRAVQLLSSMRLDDPDRVMNAYPCELSGGMSQRVAIAMAMSMEPELLLADEPTSALDVVTQAQVMRGLLELREMYGTAMIVVTHNIAVAANMADQIIVMKKGKLVESGSTESVLLNPQSRYTSQLLAAVPVLQGRDADE